jgi:hypothetical protein
MAENMDNGGRLIPYEYSGKGQEELNYNSSDSESSSSSSSDEDAYEYTQRKEKFYRDLFNSPLKKIRFSVNSKNRKDKSDPTHECVIDLEEKNIGLFNQVVGFNVISASIPHAFYTIDSNNNDKLIDAYDYKLPSLDIGQYTGTTLATEMSAKFVSHTQVGAPGGVRAKIDVTFNPKTGKFYFSDTITTQNKSISKILGLLYATHILGVPLPDPTWIVVGATDAAHISDTRRTTCLDIEIEEIPSICCIHTDHSNNIVARIPLDSSHGDVINYHSQTTDISTNHFFPIKLSKLSINILDEDGETIDINGVDYHMICEATVLGDLPEDF